MLFIFPKDLKNNVLENEMVYGRPEINHCSQFPAYDKTITLQLLPSSASIQVYSTSTQTKADVSLTPTFPSHPPTHHLPMTVDSMEVKPKTSSLLLQDVFKTIFRLIQFNL